MSLDFAKYEQVPTEFATAKEIGLAPATLGAMVRRGLVEVLTGKPNKYRRIPNKAVTIYQLLEQNKDDFEEFFMLHRKDAPYGMMCSLQKGEIVDCWGERMDLSDIDRLETRKRKFDIE